MHSESVKNILPALAKAVAEMPDPVKNKKNDHFRNSYATLGQVQECIAEPVQRNGLLVTQTMEAGNILRTRIWHVASGEWIDSVFALVLDKPGMQPLGSAITYASRYSLKTLFGMVDVDDDAEAATGRGRPAPKAEAPKPKPAPQAKVEYEPFGTVEEAEAATEAVKDKKALTAWRMRVSVSGFQGSDLERARQIKDDLIHSLGLE